MTENELVVFSAYCLGTIDLTTVQKRLGLKSKDEAATQFNEWLKVMPSFVLKKWNGVHYDAMEEIHANLKR